MLWINLGIVVIFSIFWFWFSSRFFHDDGLSKLLIRIILLFILIDCIFTLIGQPKTYWSDYSKFHEGMILARLLLGKHPLLFTFGICFWIILTTFVIHRIAHFISRIIFFSLFVGHSVGGAWTWVQYWFKNWLEDLIGHDLAFGSTYYILYWNLTDYVVYILLGILFALILRSARRLK